ncbi:origin recognition complex subunit 3 N-terminus-domain-containing protein [Mycena filopes]|nr:origin recognition complex subunit 3 N-terminus-domain-containing protein [Mycena filopes]
MQLEDIQQTTVYIPYAGDDEPDDQLASLEVDLQSGPQMRLEAYKEAWTRCLDRMKSLIAELYSPVVSDIMHRLTNIDTDVLPGLPFPEVPVITISDLSGGSRFLDHLTSRLEPEDDDDGDVLTVVNHLYANDCTNITSAMKSLIGGFIDPPKRKPTSLALYDLALLQAWYDATEDPRPNLVVLLHNFEQFDANIVQDMLYICSLQISRLPLTFMMSFSTPSPPAYLQAALTRATLALLRVYHFSVPSGSEVLNTLLLKTFFDPAVELLLFPGPTLFEFIEDYYATHSTSLDAIAHLKHYTTEPLSLFALRMPHLPPHLSPSETQFLATLLARLHAPPPHKRARKPAPAVESAWKAQAQAPGVLMQAVDAARTAFADRAKRIRLGARLLCVVVASLRGGAEGRTTTNRARERRLRLDRWRGAAAVSRAVEGEEGEGVRGLAEVLGKHHDEDSDGLHELLGELHTYLDALPQALRELGFDGRVQIVRFRSPQPKSAPASPVEIAQWLENYLAGLMQPLEESTPLWSVWYTGRTPFPSEMINPALRPSVISGLSFPYSYTVDDEARQDGENEDEDDEDLQSLPDTSILFKGYTRAGKTINVYDWFDNFRMVLEGQREAVAAAGQLQGKAKGKKGKGKVKAEAEEEEEEEKWKLAVQARFIRALHELDYLGFIKHTSRGGGGRKGEFVGRTVLGILE